MKNSPETYQIDNLDRAILQTLMQDARRPYSEIAKQQQVSPATVHVRVEKMRNAGIIAGTALTVNAKRLGYDVCCFIGITLRHAGDYPRAIAKLEALEEVIEAYYTTGPYNVFIKIMTPSIDDLQHVLIHRIQAIDEVQSTETLISLQQPIQRSIQP
ncbi:transcriptional regulator AsnC [Idiomarina sp. OT37-5b]|jgi:Lrp/AsnC family transcriptional regulator for asnA, asnC and gidA|uniref:Transcriptional regulator AsnC n=1 Tax=Idiomarina aquatica TaxID=1327752 RepID=A0AA94JDZ7_9GAMM|nr:MULTISPECIES: transcriptional regulator AsnC [Idiomarina]AVJ55795.1 transcriptional regulator AsnC [Idiomarina sp. OT37-5b]RUO44595.1 transcriptional regulator AsnC [Idiomarina aquatica]